MYFVYKISDTGSRVSVGDTADGVVETYSRKKVLEISKSVQIMGIQGSSISVYNFNRFVAEDKLNGYTSEYDFKEKVGLRLCNVRGLKTDTIRIQDEVRTIGEKCFANSAVKRVILPKGLISIYANAFFRCSSLQSINLDNVRAVGESAFEGCTSLVRVSVDDSMIRKSCFKGCVRLTEVIAPRVLFILDDAFSDCTSLTRVSLPLLATVGDRAFYNCSSLVRINPCRMHTAQKRAFENCTSLVEIGSTSDLRTAPSSFRNCPAKIYKIAYYE